MRSATERFGVRARGAHFLQNGSELRAEGVEAFTARFRAIEI
jgi:hypothetical protein